MPIFERLMSNHVGKGDNLPSTSLAGDVDGDKLVNPSENSRSKQIETLKYNPYLIIGPKY